MHQPTTITIIIMNILMTLLQSDLLQHISTYRQSGNKQLQEMHHYVMWLLPCFILPWHHKLINVTYPDISVSNIPITPRHRLFCVCPQTIWTCITIQQGYDWPGAYTEWSLQGFQMQCSIVSFFYDSVILKQCKSFKARFEDPRSLHISQLFG